MKPSEPRFAIDEAVWVNHSNTDNGWYSGIVSHILRHDVPLQNGQTPGYEGNLYILEIPTAIEPYFAMFPSGRLHRFPHCQHNTVMAGEHECHRDIQQEINAIDMQIKFIESQKKLLLRADESLASLHVQRAALRLKL